MAYQQRDNSGSLFVNDKRVTGMHPNLKGDGTMTCPSCGSNVPCWISAWTKLTKSGAKFLSLSFRPKDQQQFAARQADPPQEDSDIPF
jgi:hypothetical protein